MTYVTSSLMAFFICLDAVSSTNAYGENEARNRAGWMILSLSRLLGYVSMSFRSYLNLYNLQMDG